MPSDDARAHGDPFVPRSMRGAPPLSQGPKVPSRAAAVAPLQRGSIRIAPNRGVAVTDGRTPRVPGRPRAPNLRRRSKSSSTAHRAFCAPRGRGCAASLRANRPSSVEQLELPQVLRSIAEAAVELVGARYGALGVISSEGGLEEFIHVGMPARGGARRSARPGGTRPARRRHRHGRVDPSPASRGRPPLDQTCRDHPPMEGFLGVPIRVREAVFGNLYLTDRVRGSASAPKTRNSAPFSPRPRASRSRMRGSSTTACGGSRWFDRPGGGDAGACSRVTTDNALAVIADRLAAIVGADLVCVIVPAEPGTLRVDTARGVDADILLGVTYPRAGSSAGRRSRRGAPDQHRRAGPRSSLPDAASRRPDAVASAALRRRDARRAVGVALARRSALRTSPIGRWWPTSPARREYAIQLSRARRDRERLRMVEERGRDRPRSARPCHPAPIRLGARPAVRPPRGTLRRTRGARPGRAIDEAIGEIRTAVFALPRDSGTDRRPRSHPRRAERGGGSPRIRRRVGFSGPVDLSSTRHWRTTSSR